MCNLNKDGDLFTDSYKKDLDIRTGNASLRFMIGFVNNLVVNYELSTNELKEPLIADSLCCFSAYIKLFNEALQTCMGFEVLFSPSKIEV